MLQFRLNDTEYEFDQDKLPLSEAINVKLATGYGVQAFMHGITEMDPIALRAMVWLAKQRAGEAVRIQDIEFDVLDFCGSLNELRPGEESEAVDPTTPEPNSTGSDTGTTPPNDEPDTSPPSPSTST